MEQDQKEKYMEALAGAIMLAIGPRDEDYNKGGIGLRDYWEINGIKSPLQMVDMKLKRARSQLSAWDVEQLGSDTPVPTGYAQVEKLTESMLDLINYAAFVICEAESLAEEHLVAKNKERFPLGPRELLAQHMEKAIERWREDEKVD